MAGDLHGVWVGVVEYTSDPLKLGRVKVRVPVIHGVPNATQGFVPTESLPWCVRVENADGRVSPLQNNVQVLLTFLNGEPEQPFVLGVIPSSATEPTHYGPDEDSPGGPKSIPRETAPGPQVPDEARNLHGFDPTVTVVGSSPNGAILFMDDTSGRETSGLLDRLGQGLLLEGSASQALPRQGNFDEGTQTPKDKVQNQRARVVLGGISGSFVEIESTDAGDTVSIVNQSALGNQPSKTQVRLDMNHRDGSCRIMVVQGAKVVSEISMLDEKVSIVADMTSLNSNVTISNDLVVGGDVRVGGEVFSGGRKLG